MNTPLNHPGDSSEDPDKLIISQPSETASEIAENLILTFASSLEGKQISSFELVQSLAEFIVSTVRTIEGFDKTPPNFRRILLRNIELNFDYKDGKDQGIDLSDLLIMGIEEEMGKGLEDN
tara:strand:- start:31 stop:393 length:363 start_codon:yes stop_codon:yes gene_type:complete